MNKWILDNEGSCIRCNDIPILEGSFHKKDCEHALKLASKAPEMLSILEKLVEYQDDYFGDYPKTHQAFKKLAYEAEQLIKEATE